jgi:hypothetical protein
MPRNQGVPTLLIALCLLAGFAALVGMSSVAAVLLLGLGMAGLMVAAGAGALAMGAGVWAAVLAFAPRPAQLG